MIINYYIMIGKEVQYRGRFLKSPHLKDLFCKQIVIEKNKRTAPEIVWFQGLWSEMGDSNSRPDGPKGMLNTFSARLQRFSAVSYLFYLLFDALISVVSGCSGAVCGNLCGQKRFPPGFRWRFTGAGREAFRVSDRLHCNSEERVMQEISKRHAAQRLSRYRQRIGGKIGRGTFLVPWV